MDINRRKFLKMLVVGGGVVAAEKFFGPVFSWFSHGASAKTASSLETGFRDFRIVENKNGLSIRDDSGEEILQIDKEA